MPDIPVSKQYRHSVSELYQAYLEKRITEQELSQRLDEANEEEAKKQEHLAPSLLKLALEDIEKTISAEQKQAFEAKAQQAKSAQDQLQFKEEQDRRARAKKESDEQKAKERKEQAEQKAREAEQAQQEKDRKQFREDTKGNIHERDASARKLQRQYNTLQIILLVFSAGTATMAGIDGVARAWVAVTGVIATIAGTMLTTFKIQDRIYANHKAAAELRLECQKYDYHIEDYKGASAEDAFIKFSRAVNTIQGEQMLQEVELWNPKRNEGKKAQADGKTAQPEEDSAEQVQVVEVSEEHVAADRLNAPDEHLDESREQMQGSASSLSVPASLGSVQKPL